MAYELKDGQGSLFKNDRKESENHPDYRGDINIGGQVMWLSAWLKTSKDGKKYMSLSVKAKDATAQASAKKVAPAAIDTDDEIPFANPYRGRASYVV
jgi:uncharacterized protein (DUF736 family)